MENEELQSQETETPETSNEESQSEDTSGRGEELNAELAKYKAIAERKTKQLEKVQASLRDEEKKPEPARQTADSDKLEVIEFKLDHPELKDHLDVVRTIAKGKGISLSEAANDPLVKKVLESEGEKVSIINSNSKVATPRSEQLKQKEKVIEAGTTAALAEFLLNQEE